MMLYPPTCPSCASGSCVAFRCIYIGGVEVYNPIAKTLRPTTFRNIVKLHTKPETKRLNWGGCPACRERVPGRGWRIPGCAGASVRRDAVVSETIRFGDSEAHSFVRSSEGQQELKLFL